MKAEGEVMQLRRQEDPLARFQPESLAQAMEAARMLAGSGLLPRHLQGKPGDVLATMVAGAELGLKMMESLRAIYLVNGKVGFDSAFIASRCLALPVCERFQLVDAESNEKQAVYIAPRRGQPANKYRYTLEMAQRAGLTRNDTWSRHTEAMLRARCCSAIAKIVFPEATFGVYTRDELEEIETRREDELLPPEPTVEKELNPGTVAPPTTRTAAVSAKLATVLQPAQPSLPSPEMGPVLELGQKFKGKLVSKLTDGDLSEVAHGARTYLKEYPKGRHAKAMQLELAKVTAEMDARYREQGELGELPQEPGTDE